MAEARNDEVKANTTESDNTDKINTTKIANTDGTNTEPDLDGWKHYSDVGRQDKATMLQMEIWLLGFSTAIVYFVLKAEFAQSTLKEPLASVIMSVFGMGFSMAAAFISLLYGGYAKRNWGHADEIARAKGWYQLLPPGAPDSTLTLKAPKPSWRGNKAWKWSQHQETDLAPIFLFFFWLSVGSGLTHLLICAWSIKRIW